MRRDSWRSVPRMNRPPASMTSSCSSFAAAACDRVGLGPVGIGDFKLLALVVEAQEALRAPWD